MCGKPKCTKDFILIEIIKLWNVLPVDLKVTDLSEAGNNLCFKKKLREFYEKMFEKKFDCSRVCTWLTVCYCSQCI